MHRFLDLLALAVFDFCWFDIRYIHPNLSRIWNMDYSLITLRLGEQLRQRRLNRGLTQAALASLAGITRLKVIAIEKGDLSVG